MAVVETERNGQVLIVRMNRPESLNALNTELRQKLAETWTEFRASKEMEVAIFTGAGRTVLSGRFPQPDRAAGRPDSDRDGNGGASALTAAGLARQHGAHDAPDAA